MDAMSVVERFAIYYIVVLVITMFTSYMHSDVAFLSQHDCIMFLGPAPQLHYRNERVLLLWSICCEILWSAMCDRSHSRSTTVLLLDELQKNSASDMGCRLRMCRILTHTQATCTVYCALRCRTALKSPILTYCYWQETDGAWHSHH